MIPAISNDNVLKVEHCVSEYLRLGRWKADYFLPLLNDLDENEVWLLSFIRYYMSALHGVKIFDETLYYAVPVAQEQLATFEEFLALVRYYRRRRVNYKTEKNLILFLKNCTAQFRDFYLNILTRQRWLQVFMKYAQDHTDSSLINVEELFGVRNLPRPAPFDNQRYPLLVTTIPRKDLLPAVIFRDQVGAIHSFKYEDGKKIKLKKWLKQDSKFILQHTFALVGLVDEEIGKFYPLDYYEDFKQYQRHVKKRKVETPYDERLKLLNEFLAHHFLRQIQVLPKEYITADEEIEGAVRRVLIGSPHTVLLFRDEATQATCSQDALQVKGIIGGIWEEDGSARGFVVWHNLQPVHCSYDFTGINNALLYRPEVLIGKVVWFWLFTFKSFRSGTVKEILFDERPFHGEKIPLLDGSFAYIEKCAYCAKDGSQVAYKYRGICYTTNCNWQSSIGRYGVDRWIAPPPRLRARREATGWQPHVLNSVGFTYKGYKIVCREEDGAMMFQSDKKTMDEYLALLHGDTTWANSMRERGTIRFVTADDLRERHLKLHPKDRQENEHAADTAVNGDTVPQDQEG